MWGAEVGSTSSPFPGQEERGKWEQGWSLIPQRKDFETGDLKMITKTARGAQSP